MVLPFERFKYIVDCYKYGKNTIDSDKNKIEVNTENDIEDLFNLLNYNEIIRVIFLWIL
ncbi:hypothetical protein [Clostridium sp. Marseille-QA1073]